MTRLHFDAKEKVFFFLLFERHPFKKMFRDEASSSSLTSSSSFLSLPSSSMLSLLPTPPLSMP